MTASVLSCSLAFSPAIAAIGIDRNHVKGFTLDLNQFLQ